MQKYKVTLTLTADDYMDLAPRLGSHSPKIEKIVEPMGVRLDKSAMSAPRGKRKSKVVDTILSVLQDGEGASAGVLRTALAQRGMSESSLSTGLQILQKSGQIKRDPDSGEYHLAAREAA